MLGRRVPEIKFPGKSSLDNLLQLMLTCFVNWGLTLEKWEPASLHSFPHRWFPSFLEGSAVERAGLCFCVTATARSVQGASLGFREDLTVVWSPYPGCCWAAPHRPGVRAELSDALPPVVSGAVTYQARGRSCGHWLRSQGAGVALVSMQAPRPFPLPVFTWEGPTTTSPGTRLLMRISS